MAIDLNHGQVARTNATDTIREAIDRALSLRAERQAPRRYLGASALGSACERGIQLDFIRANDLPCAPVPAGSGFEPRTLRIFAIGHMLENLAIDWLVGGGFDLRTRGADGNQIGFSAADGQLAGHCDGVIIGGPKGAMAYPAVWEHKALGPRSWQEVVKRGVAAAKPVYAAQLALYQAYLDLPNPALFMATNRDTAELHLELVPFDPALAQAASDRAVRIIQATRAGELLPKGFAQSEHHECRRCRWSGFCWDQPG